MQIRRYSSSCSTYTGTSMPHPQAVTTSCEMKKSDYWLDQATPADLGIIGSCRHTHWSCWFAEGDAKLYEMLCHSVWSVDQLYGLGAEWSHYTRGDTTHLECRDTTLQTCGHRGVRRRGLQSCPRHFTPHLSRI